MKTPYIRNAAIALIAGIGLMATPLYAEGGQEAGTGMTQMSGMMHDLADSMIALSGEMSKGEMSTARQKQMSKRMQEMSLMLDDLSGMLGKGMTMNVEQQKKMSELRKQLDALPKEPSAATPATKKTTPHSHPRDGK